MQPQQIDRYQVQAEIARGGMAIIYLAYDPQNQRQVAIKVLPREYLMDRQFRVRFQREIEIMVAIRHSGIVPIYGYGQYQGQLYLVMRYMAGGSLDDRLQKQGSMSLAETAALIEQIAPILDFAHSQGIIHRDLKPGNILFDTQGKAFINDFGIARLTEQSNYAALTGKALIGSPAYMSPEQGRIGLNVDARSDIYSVGAMVFEMLTGQLPYDAESAMKLVMKHLTDPIPNILALNPALPPSCQAIIEKVLAKEPEQRYASVSELAAALRQAVNAGSRAAAAYPSTPPQGPRQPRDAAPPVSRPASQPVSRPAPGSAKPAGIRLPSFLNSFRHAILQQFRMPRLLGGPALPYITLPSFLRPITSALGISSTISLPGNKLWLGLAVLIAVAVLLVLCGGVMASCYILFRIFATPI